MRPPVRKALAFVAALLVVTAMMVPMVHMGVSPIGTAEATTYSDDFEDQNADNWQGGSIVSDAANGTYSLSTGTSTTANFTSQKVDTSNNLTISGTFQAESTAAYIGVVDQVDKDRVTVGITSGGGDVFVSNGGSQYSPSHDDDGARPLGGSTDTWYDFKIRFSHGWVFVKTWENGKAEPGRWNEIRPIHQFEGYLSIKGDGTGDLRLDDFTLETGTTEATAVGSWDHTKWVDTDTEGDTIAFIPLDGDGYAISFNGEGNGAQAYYTGTSLDTHPGWNLTFDLRADSGAGRAKVEVVDQDGSDEAEFQHSEDNSQFSIEKADGSNIDDTDSTNFDAGFNTVNFVADEGWLFAKAWNRGGTREEKWQMNVNDSVTGGNITLDGDADFTIDDLKFGSGDGSAQHVYEEWDLHRRDGDEQSGVISEDKVNQTDYSMLFRGDNDGIDGEQFDNGDSWTMEFLWQETSGSNRFRPHLIDGSNNNIRVDADLGSNSLGVNTDGSDRSVSHTFNANTWYWVEWNSNGTGHKAKAWKPGESEPGSYEIDQSGTSTFTNTPLSVKADDAWVDQIKGTNAGSISTSGLARSDPGNNYEPFTKVGGFGGNVSFATNPNTISGTVTDQDGDPIENATVVGVAYDHADYDAQIDQARDEINDVQEKLRNPEPPDWQDQLDDDFSFTGPGGKLRTSTEPWVLMHTQAQWQEENVFFPGGGGGANLLSDPDLTQPIGFSTDLHAPADEAIILTPWDPTRGNDFAENDIDGDLPGAAVPPGEASNIVVEQLAPGSNDITDETTFTVERQFEAGFPGKQVGFVKWNPDPGFYRIYPEGHPDNSVVYTVGKPSAIVLPYTRKLKDKQDTLIDTAQTYQDRLDNGTITRYTDTTDADGDFSFTVDARFDEVDVFAYKVPPGLDPKNATREDVREYYRNLDTDVPDAPNDIEFTGTLSAVNATSGADLDGLPGAVYLPDKPKSVTPPKSGVSVSVREVSAPDHIPIDTSRNVTDRFREWLQNLSYSDLPPPLQERLNSSGVSREDLERLYTDLDRLREQNDRLEQRYTDLLEQATDDTDVNVSLDADDATDAELRDRITKLQRALTELRNTVTAEEPTVSAGTQTVSLRFPFDANLEPENVLVRAQWSNGTTTVLNTSSPYVSIDGSVTGGDAVVISDYPIGEDDPAAVNFVVDVVTPASETPNGVDEGLGHAEQPVTNPTFDGTVPSIEAIDLSSLRPGSSDTVSLTLHPTTPSEVANITGLTVHGPGGSQVASSITGEREAEFNTSGAGTYHVSVTFDDPDGNEFTTTFQVRADDRDRSMPPGLRVVSSPVGVYALTGDGLDAGSVDVSGGGSAATITAQVGAGEDAPQRLQIYAHGLDLAPDNDLTVRIVQGDSQQALSQTIVTTIHLASLPEDALLYRNEDPLVRNGETSWGAVETNASATTIETFTEPDGTVTVSTNADPGLLDRAQHWIDVRFGNVDVPFVGVTTPLVPWDLVGGILGGEWA